MPTEFHWIRPEWLLALPLVGLFALIMARRQLAPGSWQRVVDPALAPYVLSRSPRDTADARWWLVLLGGILAALALAGPSWNRLEQPVFRSEQAIVIALDLSRSMDAQDLAPSRLTRARLKILEMLERRQSGQTALVVYSANAFTVTPLTTDADTIAALVNSLSTDIMPSRGSYPVAAIEKGLELLQQAGAAYGEVLLITDGGTSPEAERAAAELRDAGYKLSILAVGTADGAPIPRAEGGFVTDRAGRIAIPRLESEQLRSLAAAGGGRFAIMTSDNSDIESLLSDAAGHSSAADESLATDQWQDEGPWLLLLLVPLAALAFRRGWILVIALAVLPLSDPAHAFGWQDLWQTKDQQAQRKLADGDAADAAATFEDERWRAVAQYRAGEYQESAQGFRQSASPEQRDPDSLYNLGNALARAGELQAAIDAYEQALAIDPDAEDAAYNRDQVKEWLEQQENTQSGDEGNQESPSESGGEAQESDGESQADQSGEEGSSGDPGSESEQESSARGQDEMSEDDMEALQQELERAAQEAEQQSDVEDEAVSEAQVLAERRAQEQAQAMEQWLRRIPNDPGGLLRRKFRYQYQRQGMDQDGNNLWPDDEVQPW
jgi:Ca-activated chloride channel family protein